MDEGFMHDAFIHEAFIIPWTKLLLSCKIICPLKGMQLRIGFFRRKALANIKSAIKRNKQNEKRRLRNRYFAGRARTFVKKAHQAMDSGELEEARLATTKAVEALDRAAVKGIIHKNNAARRKSRLMKQLVKLERQAAE
jgi:small subunit ribosomal protein S20